ncbi:MAG: cyclic nucleotide-binding domain-containing protein [Spirochaetales bacterium]|nr:MAG: cyclic nucleotide-binding domain-containing protein [Spirochaetales bacterium]
MRQIPVKRELMMDELSDTLILQSLSVDELKHIIDICEHWEYEPGESIVTEDSVSPYLYILLEGSVDIMIRGKERENIRVSSVEKGDVFGETSIFVDVRRTASVIARTPIRLVNLSRDPLFTYCKENSKAGLKIFTFIIYSLIHKLSGVNKNLAFERESMVTQEDLERLKHLFPKSLEQILDH